MIPIAVATAFALLLGFLVWWVWRQRQQAIHEAATRAELATLGKEVRAISHDLNNLLGALLPNLEWARNAPPAELSDVLGEVETAARAAMALVGAIQGKRNNPDGSPMPSEGIVRMAVALSGRRERRIRIAVSGSMTYSGDPLDALRTIQNLLDNALREASKCKGDVDVKLDERELRITNPVHDSTRLDDSIYGEHVSYSGSTGLGLAIAVQAATRIGWQIRHEVGKGAVTFIVSSTQA